MGFDSNKVWTGDGDGLIIQGNVGVVSQSKASGRSEAKKVGGDEGEIEAKI